MVNRRSWLDLAAGTGLVVTWSSGFIGAELGTRVAPPDTLLLWRYVAATGLLAFVLCLVQARPRRHGLRRHAAIGLLCQGVYVGGVVTGVALGVPAGTAALLAAMQPLVVAVFASRLLGQRTSRVQAAGLILGLVGVGVVVAGDLGTGGGPAWIFVLPLVGMLGLSVGTVLERHWRLSDSLLQSLTVQSATVTVLLVVESTLAGHVRPPMTVDFWLAVAWVVGLSTFGGYGCYFLVLRRSGPMRVSTLLYLTPPCTLLWAALMLDQPLGPLDYLGTVICAAAVTIVLRRSGESTRGARRSGDRAAPPRPDRQPAGRRAGGRPRSARPAPRPPPRRVRRPPATCRAPR